MQKDPLTLLLRFFAQKWLPEVKLMVKKFLDDFLLQSVFKAKYTNVCLDKL